MTKDKKGGSEAGGRWVSERESAHRARCCNMRFEDDVVADEDQRHGYPALIWRHCTVEPV